jgi:hypothetical protein
VATTAAAVQTRLESNPSYQAYQVLHMGFAVLPIIAGLDKFFDVLVNWDMYLAPLIARSSPISVHSLMMIIGVVEIVAGVLVAVRPRIGAYSMAMGHNHKFTSGVRILRYCFARFRTVFGSTGARTIELGIR